MNETSGLKIGVNVDVGNVISELTRATTRFKENHTYNKQTYDELLDKYAEALELVHQLKTQLDVAQTSKIPSSEEIDNMIKMFNMFGVMNEKLPDLIKLQRSIKGLEK